MAGDTQPDVASFTCPTPLRDRPQIVMGHGGGGALSRDLVEHVFLPAFGNPVLDRLGDGREAAGSPSRPTPSSSDRFSSPAARSANSPSTARSTTSR
jgi:hypothetical protein